jgi:hypothetical protein
MKPFTVNANFHLAGIIPAISTNKKFGFPWNDLLTPIGGEYSLLHNSVMACAYAGCETIWIICYAESIKYFKNVLSNYITDPISIDRSQYSSRSHHKSIPIYYVPVPHNFKNRRDSIPWAIMHGCYVSYVTSFKISRWVLPDKFFVSFPNVFFDSRPLRQHRRQISSRDNIVLSHNEESVWDNKYLPFTFGEEEYFKLKEIYREHVKEASLTLSVEKEKKSFFRKISLDKIFKKSIIESEESKRIKINNYYEFDQWNDFLHFFRSKDATTLRLPSFWKTRRNLAYVNFEGDDDARGEEI